MWPSYIEDARFLKVKSICLTKAKIVNLRIGIYRVKYSSV
jgi:hypothetical protein